ncbi:transposase [Sphingobium yanoikuyae]|uniref:DUF2274 domain-containing protein n=1 Tax=Sphingobium yanoikuyae TaxID=13690 RepID=A0A3G2V181_SPHYA|nr:DUF2274 domain-containing protein [Sphingobium yanoikuyae]AYO80072.1 DUF2274 domain-containing protein [Sphingobium yanoikuyae]KZC74935.1 transposase [Sphingobium yanoikuyae]
MTELKLAKLPDRTPVKLTITITPDLQNALQDYAAIYAKTYGTSEPIVELIPAMLAAYLDSDRAFTRGRDANRRRKS